jgi:hypothetical protein
MAPLRTFLALCIAAGAASAAEPSRMVPAKGLEAYLEFDGLDAHAGAWNASAAHAMLDTTPAGAMIADLTRQVAARQLRNLRRAKIRGEDVEVLVRHVARFGYVVASHGHGENRASITVVLPGAGRKESRERFERLFRSFLESKNAATVRLRGREVFQVMSERPGSPVETHDPSLSWWFERDDLLILVSAPRDHLEAVLDAIEGKAPNATNHAGRLAAIAEGKAVPGFEPDGLFFIEPGKNGAFRNSLKDTFDGPFAGMNLAGGRRSDPVGGLLRAAEGLGITQQPRDFLPPLPALPAEPPPPAPPSFDPSRETFRVPPLPPEAARIPQSDRSGLPPLPDLPPRLPPLPDLPQPDKAPENPGAALALEGITRVIGRWGFHGRAMLTVVRLEAPTPRKGLLACLDARPFRKDAVPPIPRGATSFAHVALDPAKVYEEAVTLLKTLAPEMGEAVAQVEAGLKAATGPRASDDLLKHLGPIWSLVAMTDPGRDDHADPVLLATVRDPVAFAKAIDTVAARMNTTFRDREARADDSNRKKEDDLPLLALERLPAPERGYRLTSPSRLVSWFADWALEPTILVGKTSVALALHARVARAALAVEPNPAQSWTPAGETLAALDALPHDLIMLLHRDVDGSPWPTWFADFPAMVQTMSNTVADLDRPDGAAGSDVLGLLGLPQPGGFRVRIDPTKVPKRDQIKAHLFPSITAAALDERGIRLIRREAWPLACPVPEFGINETIKWSSKGFKKDLKFKATFRWD